MASGQDDSGLELRSLVKESGELELSLVRTPVVEPGPDEVVVRLEAAPINPSDLGLLLGPTDLSGLKAGGAAQNPVVTAPIAPAMLRGLKARVGQSMPVGNEGAGVVIRAGSSPEAQALLGKTVAVLGGGMYAQYRTLKASSCLLLPEGTTPMEGASCFVNPLTSLAMTQVMRREGHAAIIHTAAASNLGQMLNRICRKDGIELVNIVRRADQEALLRGMGAKHVVNSQSPTFMEDLTAAIAVTGATIAFDAIGGGKLAGQILAAMETAINRTATEYSRYGSNTHKQVYIYGGLDAGPTIIARTFGFAWSLGGFLLTPFLQKIGPAETQKLRTRVAAELKTTFASRYTREVSLAEALSPEAIAVYGKRATGEKYLINPNKGL